jgi:uncharacterized protein (UPF0332 family)
MNDPDRLFVYRLEQAESTMSNARKMFDQIIGPRSIVNRCCYAMFYATVALFLKTGTTANTSKHSGIIGIFDREFIVTGKIEKKYSRMLHRLFDKRQEFDYKEFTAVTEFDARNALAAADEYIAKNKEFLEI